MHHPAVSHRREHEWKGKIEAENRRAQTAFGKRDRMARPKRNVAKYSAILSECDFAFCTTIEVIKNRFGDSLPCDGAEILNANHSRRSYCAGSSCHLQVQPTARHGDFEAARYRTTASFCKA